MSQKEIFNYLMKYNPKTVTEIAVDLKKSKSKIGLQIKKLQRKNEVCSQRIIKQYGKEFKISKEVYYFLKNIQEHQQKSVEIIIILFI